jgi:uncharacterized protein (UPF0305 family)
MNLLKKKFLPRLTQLRVVADAADVTDAKMASVSPRRDSRSVNPRTRNRMVVNASINPRETRRNKVLT